MQELSVTHCTEYLEPDVLTEDAGSAHAHFTEAICPAGRDELRRNHVTPYRVTRFYYDQIRRGQYFQQLRHIVQPSIEELRSPGRWDTSGERDHTVLTGLQHKYPQTALLLVSANCFSYCRFCFRKRLVERGSDEIALNHTEVAAYIRQHPEITSVLLSGGDPFTLSTEQLAGIVDHLLPIPHLSSIRFGTKAIVFYPPRFRDKQLRSLFEKIRSAGKSPVIVTHIDHFGEVSEEAEVRVRELRACGVHFFNQAVLLKKINDDPETLAATFRKLHCLGVQPYYLFQARPTKRASHFQVPFHRGLKIVRDTNHRLNGLERTFRYVMSHQAGKIEILDLDRDNRLYMRYHQSSDARQVGTLFWRTVGKDACWLDGLPNSFR
jgi:KamA family protein